MREFEEMLFLLWLIVVPALVVRTGLDLLRLWNAKRRGDVGPQEYRWRSGERSRYAGLLMTNGCLVVPLLFAILTCVGLLTVALEIPDDVASNLLVLSGLVFWFFVHRWLIRRVRADFHEPQHPNFSEDLPGEPIILKHSLDGRDPG